MLPPSTLRNDAWPPDYHAVFAWRLEQLNRFRAQPILLQGAKEFYRSSAGGAQAFINHWVDTYDPRVAGSIDKPAHMPFVLFLRQDDLVEFLIGCLRDQESGLVEKCRDMGATWLCAAVSVYLWLFWPGAAVGWGSRKGQLVDKIGDPDSIFEKLRIIIGRLPVEFLPAGFGADEHMAYMRIVNPETGATITGEAGDNIGRGGRKLIYFKDESAHYARPDKIEAALADNTRVQIDISSVNGTGNVFHRRREGGVDWVRGAQMPRGKTRVFVMDWRDHPEKTQAWYDQRKAKARDDGLLHVFAQEVDRNYAASVEGVMIRHEWILAAVDADKKLRLTDTGLWGGALDVADEGPDVNALALRKGIFIKSVSEWAARDTAVTARNAVSACTGLGPFELQYDCIGIGAGIKAETNRLGDEKLLPAGLRLVPWNAGAGAQKPKERVIAGDKDSPLNEDFFENLKAQAWWNLARRFERTWRAINEPGFTWRPEDLIVIPSELPLRLKLEKELSQPVAGKSARLKLLINKTPEGTKSPNLGDAVAMAFWPVQPPTASSKQLSI